MPEKVMLQQAIGRAVLDYMEQFDPQCLASMQNSEALLILREIQMILDDNRLEDPACYQKIEALVTTFHSHGLPTSRHDFG